MSTIRFRHIDSPVGALTIAASDAGLHAIEFPGDSYLLPRRDWREGDHPLLARAQAQLDEYFTGSRKRFDLPLAPQGTPFQRQVWQRLATIPYGDTLSYGALAASLDMPAAARAVAGANARNPLSIIVPCHRVVARDGRLSGYAGGVERKQWLLDLERRARMRHAA